MSNPLRQDVRMILNRIFNTGRILNHFGKAWLIQRADGKHELVGGCDRDNTEAKEWVSLFAHDVVFSRQAKPAGEGGL
jgi:hypothetical protein